MPKFSIEAVYHSVARMEIEADSREAALDIAYEQSYEGGGLSLAAAESADDMPEFHIDEYEPEVNPMQIAVAVAPNNTPVLISFQSPLSLDQLLTVYQAVNGHDGPSERDQLVAWLCEDAARMVNQYHQMALEAEKVMKGDFNE